MTFTGKPIVHRLPSGWWSIIWISPGSMAPDIDIAQSWRSAIAILCGLYLRGEVQR